MAAIKIRGARTHNLKNIDLDLPRDKLIVITGLSGSGKSSLAFDTIFAEGQRRYVESLSAYARQFLARLEKPDVDTIEGLSPAISIEQKTTGRNPRSTVGTITEISDYLRVLYARVGIQHCHECGRKVESQTAQHIAQELAKLPEGTRLLLLGAIAVAHCSSALHGYSVKEESRSKYPTHVVVQRRRRVFNDRQGRVTGCGW